MTTTQTFGNTIPSNMDATSALSLLDNIVSTSSVGTMGNHHHLVFPKHFRRCSTRTTVNGKKRSPSGYNLFFHMIREDILLSESVRDNNTNRHPIFSKKMDDILKFHMIHFNPKRIEDAAISLRTKPKRKHVKQKNFPISFSELTQIVSQQWKILIPSVRQMFLTQAIAETQYYHQEITPTIQEQIEQQQAHQNGRYSVVNEPKITDMNIDYLTIASNQISPVKSSKDIQERLVTYPQSETELQLQLQTQLQSKPIQSGIKEQDFIIDDELQQNQDSLHEYKLQSIMRDEIKYEIEVEINDSIKNNMILEGHDLTNPVEGIETRLIITSTSSVMDDHTDLNENDFGDLSFNPISEDDDDSFHPIQEHDDLELEYFDYDFQHIMHEMACSNKEVDNEKDGMNHIHSLYDDDETHVDHAIMSDYNPISHQYYDKIIQSNHSSNNRVNNINKDTNNVILTHESKHLLLDDVNTYYPPIIDKFQLNDLQNIAEKRKYLSILCGLQPSDFFSCIVQPNLFNFMQHEDEVSDNELISL